MSRVYLSLGSNVGDTKGNLLSALERLNKHPDNTLIAVSSYYETAPIGFTEQDAFINIAAYVDTTLTPHEFLKYAQSIELDLKRERGIHWGPRTIDVDLLLFDKLSLNDDDLTLPHPHMLERAFVLVPLEEIAPELSIEDQPLSRWVEKVSAQQVKRIGACKLP